MKHTGLKVTHFAVPAITNHEEAVNGAMLPVIRIIIIDDQVLFRDGLANLLSTQPDFRIAGSTDNATVAVDQIRNSAPDIILLGWPAHSARSQRILAAVQESKAATRIITIACTEGKEDVVEAVKQGYCGVLPRQCPTELLAKSIRKVHAGEFWLDRLTTAEVIRRLARKNLNNNGSTRLGVRDQSAALSQREREIVVLIAQGFKNKEMAERMFISEQTVKNHLHNIFDKLGVSDRLELALYAIHHRLHENG
jgi:DNA-binding NarL/FixJ family response regulator